MRQGGSLTIHDGSKIDNTNSVTAGLGNGGGTQNGQAVGGGIFLDRNVQAEFNPAAGQSVTVGGSIGGGNGDSGILMNGPGTLDLSLGGANTYSGGTTIDQGVVRIGADNNLGDAAGGLTFNGGTLQTFTGNGSITTNRTMMINAGGATIDTHGGTFTMAGQVSGVGGLTLNDSAAGSGKLTLSNTLNNYSGGTTIDNGILSVADDRELGTGGVTLNGNSATLLTTSGLTTARTITLNGGGNLDSGGNTSTFSGVISGNGGLDIASSQGGGMVVLSNVGNNYTGDTTINTGSLSISDDRELGGLAGSVRIGNKFNELQFTSGVNSARSIVLGVGTAPGGGTLDYTGGQTSLSGVISGSGGLFITHSSGSNGQIYLSGPNTYTGDTTVTSAVLAVDRDANLGDVSGNIFLNNKGVLVANSDNFSSARAITLGNGGFGSGGGGLDEDGHTATFSGDIIGIGGLAIKNSGAADVGSVVLSGHNAFTGGLTIGGGATLSAANDYNLGSTAAGNDLTIKGGTLDTTTGIDTSRNLTLNGGGTVEIEGDGAITYLRGTVGGSGGLTIANTTGGTAGVVLTNSNNYTGDTTINSGFLGVTSDQSLGDVSGAVAINNHATLATVGVVNSARSITLGGAGGGQIDTHGNVSSFSGPIGGSGGLTIYSDNGGGIADGAIFLSGANTYTGGTTVDNGVLNVNSDSNLGDASGGVTLNNGSGLFLQQAMSSARSITLGAGGGVVNTKGHSSSLTGVIGGTGGLSVTDDVGGGSLALSGNNTFTGGVTIDGGALSVASDANLGDASGGVTINKDAVFETGANMSTARAFTLSGGGKIDTHGHVSTLSGAIGGSGGLTMFNDLGGSWIGGGAFFLSGNNTYTGGTTINNGILNINSDDNLGDASGHVAISNLSGLWLNNAMTINRGITLNGAGGTINSAGHDSTLAGVIDGAGKLQVMDDVGGGKLTLSGANTYSGGTFIQDGALLSISADDNLGDASGGITFNGGTLQTSAGISSSRGVTMNVDGIIDTNGYDSTLSGVVSGSAGLDKIGAGTLKLNAVNTYGGATTVNAGTLALGVAGALPANALTVASGAALDMAGHDQSVGATVNNGTINAGAGQLTIHGDHSGTGNLNVTLQSGVTNVVVTGNATLTGETLNPSVSAVPAVGDVFTVVSAGALSGQFTAINDPTGVYLVPTYSGTQLVLKAAIPSFQQAEQDSTSGSVGTALDTMRANGGFSSPDGTVVLNSLNFLTSSQFQKALNDITPNHAGQAMGAAGPTFSGLAVGLGGGGGALAMRANDLLHGPSGAQEPLVAHYSVSGVSYPGTLIAYASDDLGALGLDAPSDQDGSASRLGFFTSALGSEGRLNDSDGGPGYGYTAGGFSSGADYRFNDNFTGGAMLSYVYGRSIISQGGGEVNSQSVRLGVYSVSRENEWYSTFYLGGAKDFFSVTRNINFPGIARTATSSPGGLEVNADSQFGYDVSAGRYTVSPFVGLAFDEVRVGHYTESGAGALDLSVGQQKADSLRTTAGMKLSPRSKAGARWRPYLSLAWQRELRNPVRSIDAQLDSGAGSAFASQTAPASANAALLGLGLTAMLRSDLTGKLAYTGDFRSNFIDHTLDAELRFRF
ncbi:MAG: autotransporter domain-containing protein [Elusimicrobia bacterium]|nr:autotransporter domain-containing protein [Elusimicrobiota bacterium]